MFKGSAENPSKARRRGILFLLLAGLCPPYIHAQDTLCAVVKLEILQEAALEREAFDARLALTNNLPTESLQNLKVDVLINDLTGTSAGELFFIKVSSLERTNAVDGTGIVQPNTQAVIHWLIIPSTGAGRGNPLGLRYAVKAKISYAALGGTQEISTFEDFITVKPQPLLRLEYVLPFEVFADEPLTAAIEPIEPFHLGVRVTNTGFGAARNFTIESAQPKIIENKLSLPIDFKLLGTFVGIINFPGDMDGLRVDATEHLVYVIGSDTLEIGQYAPEAPPVPPEVGITSPEPGLKVIEGGTVRVAATASDNVGVARVEFLVNGVVRESDEATLV